MTRSKRNNHGVITVLISLMLTGILSFGTMVIEAGRLQGARTQLDDANLSAGTSMIASYNSTLYERYGLLAIDNDMLKVGRYREYLEFNSDSSAGFKGNNISTLYTVKSTEIEGLYNLTYPSVLKRQILSRAKFNIVHADYSLNRYNADYLIDDYQQKASEVISALKPVVTGKATTGTLNDVPADMRNALGNLYGTFNKSKKFDANYNVTIKPSDMAILPSTTGTVKHSVPNDDIDAINEAVSDANTVIGSNGSLLASNAGSKYKETDVTLDTSFAGAAISKFANLNKLPSNAVSVAVDCNKLVQGVNGALNILNADRDGNLLLNLYVAGYFPNKNFAVNGYVGSASGSAVSGVDSAAFSRAGVEYVISGNASETTNQQNAYNFIVASRLVSNLHSVITNSKSFNGNNACLVAAHIAWAYYETLADVELLFNHNAVVPINKYNMILPINNAGAVSGAFAAKDFLSAMRSLGVLKDNIFTIDGYDQTNYRDALAFALWFVPNSKKMLRVADLVQLEMRYRERYIEKSTPTFLMSEQNTFCRVKCSGNLNSVLPVISISDGEDVKGTPIQSIKYVGY